MENQLEVANIIREQLLAFGRVKVMSWAAHAWVGGKDFLQFKVSGFKFKGSVKITLHPCDYYIIEFIKPLTTEPIHKVDMCYFDQMTEIIDEYVEFTGKNYQDDVNNAVYKF